MTYVPRASLHGVDLSGPTALKPDNGPVGSLWFDETTHQLHVQTTDGMESIGGTTPGTVLYVDSVNGNDDSDGLSWNDAYLTIAAAVADAVAGDTILIRGSFNEAVTCSLAGVRFIGVGTGPKQASWTAPTVAGSWCLKIAANYVQVANIYFKPVIYVSSGIPSGIYLSGANWAMIFGCRFQGQIGSYRAIYSPVCDSDNVHIENCEFLYMNTATYGAAIWLVEAGGLSYSGWVIRDCLFNSCVTAISLAGRACLIQGNSVMTLGITAAGAVAAGVCTVGINLRGDLASANNGANAVHGNFLGGTYSISGGYKPCASGDDWAGNFNIAGITTANPA